MKVSRAERTATHRHGRQPERPSELLALGARRRSPILCRVTQTPVEEEMVVTVATFTESGAQLEEGVRHVKEEVVPAIQGAKGLVAGYWVVDRERGQRLSIMAWESAEAMSAAMPSVMASVKRARDEAGREQPQRSPDSSQRYEVVAQV